MLDKHVMIMSDPALVSISGEKAVDIQESERYKRGQAKLSQLNHDAAERLKTVLADIAPEMADHVVSFAYGDFYAREVLDMKTRSMITISSLVTQGGCERELKAHLQGALNLGWTRQEVVEALMQLCVYAGFPRSLEAIYTAKALFEELDREESES